MLRIEKTHATQTSYFSLRKPVARLILLVSSPARPRAALVLFPLWPLLIPQQRPQLQLPPDGLLMTSPCLPLRSRNHEDTSPGAGITLSLLTIPTWIPRLLLSCLLLQSPSVPPRRGKIRQFASTGHTASVSTGVASVAVLARAEAPPPHSSSKIL